MKATDKLSNVLEAVISHMPKVGEEKLSTGEIKLIDCILDVINAGEFSKEEISAAQKKILQNEKKRVVSKK